jgi:predicted aspartyl protease
MGTFRTSISIENPARRGELHELPDALVDTGSEFTWVPREALEAIGIARERVQRFLLADGTTVERAIGFAIVHAAGLSTADDVVFAEPGDMLLLGARSLEGLNLRVDARAKRLVPAGPIVTAVAASDRAA